MKKFKVNVLNHYRKEPDNIILPNGFTESEYIELLQLSCLTEMSHDQFNKKTELEEKFNKQKNRK